MRSIGIDIGNYSLKIAEVEALSRGYLIHRVEEHFLSQDPSKDRKLEIIDLLRQFVNQVDTSDIKFVLSLSQTQVASRSLFFPFKERHKILKSVPFELEDDIPFSQEHAIFDAKICRYLGPGAEVLASAVPKEHIHQILQLASDGGIDVDIVTSEGLAATNLFEKWFDLPPQLEPQDENATPEPAAGFIVLDLGHRKTNMLTYRKDCLVDIRSFNWGGADIAKKLTEKYNLHITEAIKQLNKKGFLLLNNDGASADQIEFSDLIKSCVDELAQNVRFSLIELQTEYNIDFKSASMIGGLAQLKNLHAYLTQKLEVACNPTTRFQYHLEIDFNNQTLKAATCAQAVAMAVEGIKKPKNPPSNFLRGEFEKKSQSMRVFWEKWQYSIGLASALLVVIFIYGLLRQNLSATAADEAYYLLKTQTAKITNTSGLKANTSTAKRFIREQQRLAKSVKSIEDLKKINSAMDILRKISERVPGRELRLNVTSVSIRDTTVRLQGEVASQRASQSLQSYLKSLAEGPITTTQPSTPVRPGYTGFSFEFKVNRKTGV